MDKCEKNETFSKKKSTREVWSNGLDFLFSCLSYAVGFGNIWRFPYLCYKNGGGAFLIPYFVCVIVGGFPMLFLEFSLGQYTSRGGMQAWQICPLMKGMGAASTIILALAHVYYIIILAWTLMYLFSSFTSVLPWSNCHNSWNTLLCRDSQELLNVTLINNTDYLELPSNHTLYGSITLDYKAANVTEVQFTDSAVEFWEKRILRISDGINQLGFPEWDLSLCLLFSWTLTALCTLKGIKSSGKVMYITFIMPYVMLIVLLIRGVTLPGAAEGIKYYMIPKWERLADSLVWADAGMQVFYSYAVGAGVNIALGSFNKFNTNCLRDAAIISFGNSFTSFFAGFAIFSVLGFMAHEQGVSVENVAESGPGLSFIVYPKALAQMPFAPVWSVLFFTMLFMLGLGSHIGAMESILAAILDEFPKQLRKGHRRIFVMLTVYALMFAIGLTMVTSGGMYIFQLFDYFASSKTIVLVGFLQCVTISYLYGITKYYSHLKEMLGFTPTILMKFDWAIAAPLYTLIIYVFSMYNYTEVTYNKVYVYPRWAVACGWIMSALSIVMVPIFIIVGIVKTPGNIRSRIRTLLGRNHEDQVKDRNIPVELKEANERQQFI